MWSLCYLGLPPEQLLNPLSFNQTNLGRQTGVHPDPIHGLIIPCDQARALISSEAKGATSVPAN